MQTKLTAEQRAEALEHLRDACVSLAECWDALGELESILEIDVETDDIQGMTGNLSDSLERGTIDEDDLDPLIESLDDEDEEEATEETDGE